MNYLKLSPFFILLSVFSFISCSDDDGPSDFRLALEGDYEVDDIELNFSTSFTDTTFEDFDINPEITLEIDDDLDSDEMAINLEEFIEDALKEFFTLISDPITISIEFEDDDDLIAEVSSDGEFETDDIEFDATLSAGGSATIWNCEIEISGEVAGGEMAFEYEINVSDEDGDTGTFQGEGIAIQ